MDDRVLWANLHLLLWLSLVPFATAWIGENGSATWPAAVYGMILPCAGGAYYLLTLALIALHGRDSAIALGKDFEDKISLLIYAAGIALAFLKTKLAFACFIAVAVIWLVPDRRIEWPLARPDGPGRGR